MSRIGKLPLELPKGVEVKLGADVVEVKGPKGTLTTPKCALLDYKLEDGVVTLTRLEETREAWPAPHPSGQLCGRREQGLFQDP